MKIYRLSVYTEAFRWYHFASRREVNAFVRQTKREYAGESFSIDVDVLDIQPTRKGIADALDGFVRMTAINEF